MYVLFKQVSLQNESYLFKIYVVTESRKKKKNIFPSALSSFRFFGERMVYFICLHISVKQCHFLEIKNHYI